MHGVLRDRYKPGHRIPVNDELAGQLDLDVGTVAKLVTQDHRGDFVFGNVRAEAQNIPVVDPDIHGLGYRHGP